LVATDAPLVAVAIVSLLLDRIRLQVDRPARGQTAHFRTVPPGIVAPLLALCKREC
jgi:hypothetical protein